MIVGSGVAAQIGRQRRRGRGGGDHHQAGLAEDGRGRRRGHGAGCADHADDAPVADHRLGGRRAALRAAQRVEAGAHGDVVSFDRAVVGHSQRDAALAGHAQVTGAGERSQRTNVNIFAGADHDRAQGGGFEFRRQTGGAQNEKGKQTEPSHQWQAGDGVSSTWLSVPWSGWLSIRCRQPGWHWLEDQDESVSDGGFKSAKEAVIGPDSFIIAISALTG